MCPEHANTNLEVFQTAESSLVVCEMILEGQTVFLEEVKQIRTEKAKCLWYMD